MFPLPSSHPGLSPDVSRPPQRTRPSQARPIDLVHLAAMTVGDRALEREILQLLREQIEMLAPRIRDAGPGGQGALAHALKGAARNVGAFGLAEAAAEVEKAPGEEQALAGLEAELAAVRAFLSRLLPAAGG